MPSILIVDDEPNVLYSFEKGLTRAIPDLRVEKAETGADALRAIHLNRPNAVVLDVRLPDVSGLKVCEQIYSQDPRIPIIIVTAHSTTDTVIGAMKNGAFDYLLKPVDIHQLAALVRKALDVSRMQNVPALIEEGCGGGPAERIVGRSPAMQEVYKSIGRVAQEDLSVLVLGESGTGKELVARAIYHHSSRAEQPFLPINCAALPETLLESELFGHEGGAFTGADRARVGKFEQAHTGTLFLDELGDMSLATQAKLLRVLQDGCVQRVGGNRFIQTDVRIIAATNQDLTARMREGRFREDLYYRLNGLTIRLPPLRERIEDLPILTEHIIRDLNIELQRKVTKLAPETIGILRSYDWPGNIRELRTALRHAVLHSVGDVITPESLPDSCRSSSREYPSSEAGNQAFHSLAVYVRELLRLGGPDLYRSLMADVDRVLLSETLEHVEGNQVHASQRLGISRTTLRSKLGGVSPEQPNAREHSG